MTTNITQQSQEWQQIKKPLNPRSLDITGKRFNKLVAIEYKYHNKWNQQCWLFRCDCGKEIVTEKRRIVQGQLSCGCMSSRYKPIHNLSRSDTYNIWEGMKQRCNNPNYPRFKDYGGRGVKMHGNWDKFENFLADMGERPSKHHSIDRIDNNGNYEPSNCRWATRKQQDRNRSNSINLTNGGKAKSLKEWALLYGVHYNTAFGRFKKGLSFRQIFKKVK